MGKELELQKACQNFDTLAVKKLLQKHCTPSGNILLFFDVMSYYNFKLMSGSLERDRP